MSKDSRNPPATAMLPEETNFPSCSLLQRRRRDAPPPLTPNLTLKLRRICPLAASPADDPLTSSEEAGHSPAILLLLGDGVSSRL
ncbi:hypothetical protein Q3G72_014508 [Acer saccharum]|nr:hypothetical protein Q3G72_014508 [Acer saccharum]